MEAHKAKSLNVMHALKKKKAGSKVRRSQQQKLSCQQLASMLAGRRLWLCYSDCEREETKGRGEEERGEEMRRGKEEERRGGKERREEMRRGEERR